MFNSLLSTLSYGSLYSLYNTLCERFTSSANIAYLIGSLRIRIFPERIRETDSEDINTRNLRKTILEKIPEELLNVLSQSETARRCRLSIMSYFESYQSSYLCKNFAMHLLDTIISLIFPTINVWVPIVKT